MFEGKNILVVGASSGIGYDLSQDLLQKGANLFTASRQAPEGLDGATHIPLDVTELDKELDALPKELHGLVYCPGSITLKPFKALKEKDFLADFQINVLGAVKVLQAAHNNLRKAGSSSVVLFSTVAVQTGINF
ncbi:MAG: SDR family oxidoreductase, partial [Bacteroidota bacterium]